MVPSTTVSAWSQGIHLQTCLPRRYWAHRAPYIPQPSMVAKANRHSAAVRKIRALPPSTWEKAAAVSSIPASPP